MTALKSLLFLIIAPGMVAGYIPLGMFRRGAQIETGVLAYIAFPLWVLAQSSSCGVSGISSKIVIY